MQVLPEDLQAEDQHDEENSKDSNKDDTPQWSYDIEQGYRTTLPTIKDARRLADGTTYWQCQKENWSFFDDHVMRFDERRLNTTSVGNLACLIFHLREFLHEERFQEHVKTQEKLREARELLNKCETLWNMMETHLQNRQPRPEHDTNNSTRAHNLCVIL